MNTWKNNNILERIKESYFLEDTDRGEVSESLADVKPVGGTIFYIDDTADGKYEFFDIDGNLMENVQVGDRPHTYRVVEKGSKDKYYVYHDKAYHRVRWTYCEDHDYVYELLDTSEDVGSGKTNTEKVMAEDSYITGDSNGYPTIWYQLQQTRDARIGGCDDWFVPSVDELDLLRMAIESGNIKGGMVAGSSYNTSVFNNKYLWTSSETSSLAARAWDRRGQYWDGLGKYGLFSVLFTRAF